MSHVQYLYFFSIFASAELLMVWRICITNPFSMFEFWCTGWCSLPIMVFTPLAFIFTIPDPFPDQNFILYEGVGEIFVGDIFSKLEERH